MSNFYNKLKFPALFSVRNRRKVCQLIFQLIEIMVLLGVSRCYKPSISAYVSYHLIKSVFQIVRALAFFQRYFQRYLRIDRFRLESDLLVLVSHLYLLRDDRKGRESTRVKLRMKRGREDSDPNGIGLY